MTRWLLDDGALDVLASRTIQWTGRELPGVLEVMSEVATSATASLLRTQLLAREQLGAPLVEQHEILVGSDEEAYLTTHLRANVFAAKEHLGEHEAIAWCRCRDQDIVFVSMDKGAVYLALAELGRARVATPFDVWRDLLDRDWIDAVDFDRLCKWTAARSSPQVKVPRRFGG
ncbi:MAG: hypothetical protein Q8S73_37390 [Deltaproteobacteria bacterium]|nr:hypothetical protein [Myxococcales bacterium]MDP3219837.1 hypothetical protein [Deltaproteobacteria bacterium]